jgi:uncharacterized protein (DUF952 family)
MEDVTLYKVLRSADWDDACATGVFSGCGIDLTDGFIHLSARSQVAETVQRHFAGQDNLLLLSVTSKPLGESLRWEVSRDGALFPHVYGEIPIGAVLSVDELVLGDDGVHRFPESF